MRTLAILIVALAPRQEEAAPLYRFPVGTEWELTSTVLDRKSTVRSRVTAMEGGKVTVDAGQGPSILTVRDGFLVQESPGGETIVRILKVGARKGESWKSSEDAESTHLGTVEVSVPAGTYKDAILVRCVKQATEEETWIVPGIGVVRFEERRGGIACVVTELSSVTLGGAAPVDLSKHHNAKLDKSWHPGTNLSDLTNNDLGDLPRGHHVFAGTLFNAAGVVQLQGKSAAGWGGAFPEKAEGIGVDRKARKVHFLHSTGWSDKDGVEIAKYVIRTADGKAHERLVQYGVDVRDWWYWPDEPLKAKEGALAWSGQNTACKAQGMSIRLFKSTWENPTPDVAIKSIDYVSSMAKSAPFLVAVTTEP